MNKIEFLKTLRAELQGLPTEELEDILYDYEEHFLVGIEKGKTEEAITQGLGDPKSIAKSYKANAVITTAQNNPTPSNILKAVLSAVSLGFFNLIIVLGPFLAMVGILIGLFTAAFGVTIAGITAIAAPFLKFLVGTDWVALSLHPVASFFIGIGLIALGILFFIFDIFLGKILFKGTIRYLKWNVEIIKN